MEQNITVQSNPQYIALVEECKAIVSQRVKNSRWELIVGYGEVGERICNAPQYKKHGKGNRKFSRRLFSDIGIGERTGYQCIQFFENHIKENPRYIETGVVCTGVQTLFPEEGDNLSWNKIKTKYLPQPKQEKLVPAEGKYQVIVIDPPWKYGTVYNSKSRRVASPYPEIEVSELKKFKIPADKDSIIWLWTTHKFLPEAFELLKVWGFEYKICFVWDKQKMGMGSWLRCQAEFCLLGVKGKPNWWDLTNQRDILSIARQEHSRKPDGFYQLVGDLCPDTKKIDIFSRETRVGWFQYGNEKNKFSGQNTN